MKYTCYKNTHQSNHLPTPYPKKLYDKAFTRGMTLANRMVSATTDPLANFTTPQSWTHSTSLPYADHSSNSRLCPAPALDRNMKLYLCLALILSHTHTLVLNPGHRLKQCPNSGLCLALILGHSHTLSLPFHKDSLTLAPIIYTELHQDRSLHDAQVSISTTDGEDFRKPHRTSYEPSFLSLPISIINPLIEELVVKTHYQAVCTILYMISAYSTSFSRIS